MQDVTRIRQVNQIRLERKVLIFFVSILCFIAYTIKPYIIITKSFMATRPTIDLSHISTNQNSSLAGTRDSRIDSFNYTNQDGTNVNIDITNSSLLISNPDQIIDTTDTTNTTNTTKSNEPIQSSNNIINNNAAPYAKWNTTYEWKPPRTPGAFIHVSKTGGSTLAALLRNGCHSYIPKPCHTQVNESHVSLLTSYYHIPDFENGKMKKRSKHHSFYVISVRDPLERTISSYSVSHPDNIITWKYIEKYGNALDDNGQPKQRYMTLLEKKKRKKEDEKDLNYKLFTCFPTLEEFAQTIGETHEDYKLKQVEKETAMPVKNIKCEKLARGVIHNQYKQPMQHLYYNLQLLWIDAWDGPSTLSSTTSPTTTTTTSTSSSTTNNNITMFIARNEQKWYDWIRINEMLGQQVGTVATFPHDSRRNSTNFYLPVGRELSETGRMFLCNALFDEYVLYVKLLRMAVNLSEEDVLESIQSSRENCPNIFDGDELVRPKTTGVATTTRL